MTTIIWKNDAHTEFFPAPSWEPASGPRRLHLLIIKEEGGVSAIVLNLPGTGSCGATEEEAIESAKDSVREAIASYGESGEDVPWVDSTSKEVPPGAFQKWIILDA